MTDSLDDPFVQRLMDEFSHAGYVAWFGLIEIIAKENGNEITGNLTISPAYLKRKLRISQTKLQQIFGFCQTFAKLSVDFQKENWIFQFHKIQEIKDNYTKDLQGACKKPSNHKEVEVDKEEDKERDILPVREIIEYLNQKAGTAFKHSSQKTKTLIHARMSEGFTLENFKTVINNKVASWLNDKDMCKYLRPETLFGTKFEGYLNEKSVTPKEPEFNQQKEIMEACRKDGR
jgi:uncharacterized phage protein (TIGR02220 family)